MPGRAGLYDQNFMYPPGMFLDQLTSRFLHKHIVAGTRSAALPDCVMMEANVSSHEGLTFLSLPAGTLRLPARRGS